MYAVWSRNRRNKWRNREEVLKYDENLIENPAVGCWGVGSKYGSTMVACGLGSRNDRREILINFYEKHML